MNDYIDRRAAIDAVNELTKWYLKTYHETRPATAAVIGRLMDLPSVQSAERWVPCSERLPEATYKRYWVCTDAGGQHECRWTNNRFGLGESDEWGWSIFDTPQYSKVVAWMPLPEPYEEEEGEEA